MAKYWRSYTSGNRAYRAPDKKNPIRAMSYRAPTPAGLKPKDLVGFPWRLAFALQEAGWFLRSDIVWEKPNCMPESVRDRPTRAHEYLFLLTKSLKYYYNAKNISEPNGETGAPVWSIPTEPFLGAHLRPSRPSWSNPAFWQDLSLAIGSSILSLGRVRLVWFVSSSDGNMWA